MLSLLSLLVLSSMVGARRIGGPDVEPKYPMKERKLATMHIALADLPDYRLTFNDDSPPKDLDLFYLQLFDTDGDLPQESLEKVSQALENCLQAELDVIYDPIHSVQSIDARFDSQSAYKTGSQLLTDIEIIFNREPSPEKNQLELWVQSIMADMTCFLTNLTALADGDPELANVTSASREPYFANRGDPSTPSGAQEDVSSGRSSLNLMEIIPSVVAGVLVVTMIGVFMLVHRRRRRRRNRQAGPIKTMPTIPERPEPISVLLDEDSDIFSFEVALVESPAVGGATPKSTFAEAASETQSKVEPTHEEDDTQSDLFSGLSSAMPGTYSMPDTSHTHDESRSVFSFFSNFSRGSASTIRRSNVTRKKKVEGAAASDVEYGSMPGTPGSKMSSLFAFSEEHDDEDGEDDLQEIDLNTDEATPPNVPFDEQLAGRDLKDIASSDSSMYGPPITAAEVPAPEPSPRGGFMSQSFAHLFNKDKSESAQSSIIEPMMALDNSDNVSRTSIVGLVDGKSRDGIIQDDRALALSTTASMDVSPTTSEEMSHKRSRWGTAVAAGLGRLKRTGRCENDTTDDASMPTDSQDIEGDEPSDEAEMDAILVATVAGVAAVGAVNNTSEDNRPASTRSRASSRATSVSALSRQGSNVSSGMENRPSSRAGSVSASPRNSRPNSRAGSVSDSPGSGRLGIHPQSFSESPRNSRPSSRASSVNENRPSSRTSSVESRPTPSRPASRMSTGERSGFSHSDFSGSLFRNDSESYSEGSHSQHGHSRRHAKSMTADGTTAYQSEAMNPLDWSIASAAETSVSDASGIMGPPRLSIDAVSLKEVTTRNSKNGQPVSDTPKSAITNATGFSETSHTSVSDASTTSRSNSVVDDLPYDANPSPSKKLISDLVWLERKIAGSAKNANASNAEAPPRRVEQVDSMSFVSNDVNVSNSNSLDSSMDLNSYNGSSALRGLHSIVCRDCFAPPGKLKIVIHSTKDGPAVHTVKMGSSLEGHIFPGDLIISVDNVDTRTFTAEQVMKMMTARARQERKITVLHFEEEEQSDANSSQFSASHKSSVYNK